RVSIMPIPIAPMMGVKTSLSKGGALLEAAPSTMPDINSPVLLAPASRLAAPVSSSVFVSYSRGKWHAEFGSERSHFYAMVSVLGSTERVVGACVDGGEPVQFRSGSCERPSGRTRVHRQGWGLSAQDRC